MRIIQFRAIGGPLDGDVIPMPISTVPTSKSLMLQNHKDKMGHLNKYFFNRLTETAVFQGAVQVAQDEVG